MEVPERVLQNYFRADHEYFVLDRVIRESVKFRRQNILEEDPLPGMDIIFCRNLAFTYFSKESQMKALKKIFSSLKEKGYLVIGKDEFLPLVYPTLFVLIFPAQKVYQKFTP
jgi:chemotaxis methyl-accepting protein methylase